MRDVRSQVAKEAHELMKLGWSRSGAFKRAWEVIGRVNDVPPFYGYQL
jgi:hypothetical protein